MVDFAKERAKQGLEPLSVELHRVPFFLEPGYIEQPDDWWEPHYTRQTRKFGSLEAFEAVKHSHRLMPRACEAGLDALGWTDENLDQRRQSSTLRAHRLIAWLDQTVGWERAEMAMASLHDAHFVRQGLLNDVEVLSAAAAAASVDHSVAVEFLRGGEGRDEILRKVRGTSTTTHEWALRSQCAKLRSQFAKSLLLTTTYLPLPTYYYLLTTTY